VKRVQIVLLAAALGSLFSGCVASRKFVRNEVKTSSDHLSSELDRTNGEVKETRDNVDQVNQKVSGVDQRVSGVDQRVSGVDQKVTTVDGKVVALDTKTTQGMNSLKSDVNTVGGKADEASRHVASLDREFQNRNNFAVSMQKAIPFKFDSAQLATDGKSAMDEIVSALGQNPDAFIVLEGHTDSTGDKEYNMRLGERRVDAVRRYLAIDKSIPVYKIEDISFGAERPLAPNDSRENREKNRSVNIMVLIPSMTAATASAR